MPEYLGSWVDTSTKRAITSFVASDTDHDLNGGVAVAGSRSIEPSTGAPRRRSCAPTRRP